MKASELTLVLRQLLQAKENVMLVGRPGLGKTALVQQAATALDFDLVLMHPVVSDPTDYKGLPGIFDGVAQFFPIGELRTLLEATRPTICFLDDFGQAPPAVQAAAMQLVWGGKLNGHTISEHVRFIVATNRREDKAAVGGIITPFVDRMTAVLQMDFDLSDFITWWDEQRLPEDMPPFLRFRPTLMETFTPSKDIAKYPTPRSVAGLGRLVQLGIESPAVLSGAVGEGFAAEYLAFRRVYYNLPSVDSVIADPKGITVPTKLDVLYALMGALSHAATPKNIAAIGEFIKRVPEEHAILCLKDASRKHKTLAESKAFITLAMHYAKALR